MTTQELVKLDGCLELTTGVAGSISCLMEKILSELGTDIILVDRIG